MLTSILPTFGAILVFIILVLSVWPATTGACITKKKTHTADKAAPIAASSCAAARPLRAVSRTRVHFFLFVLPLFFQQMLQYPYVSRLAVPTTHGLWPLKRPSWRMPTRSPTGRTLRCGTLYKHHTKIPYVVNFRQSPHESI